MHKAGQSRYQATLFPQVLDEAVRADHPVRVIDGFVDSLDMAALGFSKAAAEATGRPPYHPGDLLKLYIYGYLNQIRSSRRLAREAQRNIEVQWLINRLAPAFKTIADFRKDHAEAIVGVSRAFIRFCRGQSLFGGQVLAVDGTKIEAVASRKQVVTPQSLAKQEAAIDRKIAEYLAALDEADRQEPMADDVAPGSVTSALAALQAQREEVRRQAERLVAEGLSQLVLTEEEARLMRTAHHGHQVAYNAQSVVDAEHKLIVAFDLTNQGNDHRSLHPMAMRGREAVQVEHVTVVADSGYANGEQGQLCAGDGITAVVPRPATVNPKGEQYFTRDAFAYDAAADTWRCPAGETLTCRDTSLTEQRKRYTTKACGVCALKPRCTKAAQRTIVRGFFEDVLQAMHQRATDDPTWMRQRRCLVEHPFGTIKWLMGKPRFLVRGLRKAKAELALSVLGFNLKRTINILGAPALLAKLRPVPG